MPIFHCPNPRAAGYDPNSYGANDEETRAAHFATHEVTYEGAVLATFERNMYDDSDFCAVVYDAEKDTLEEVMYGTTRGWTYHDGAKVDATEDVKEKAERALARQIRETILRTWGYVQRGKRVRSLTTRGKAKGVTGWIEEVTDHHTYGTRVAVRVDQPESVHCGRIVWIAYGRVEVIGEPDVTAIEEHANKIAARRQWTSEIRRAQFETASTEAFFPVLPETEKNEEPAPAIEKKPVVKKPAHSPKKSPAPANEKTKKSGGAHANCQHESTKSARAKCRRERSKK